MAYSDCKNGKSEVPPESETKTDVLLTLTRSKTHSLLPITLMPWLWSKWSGLGVPIRVNSWKTNVCIHLFHRYFGRTAAIELTWCLKAANDIPHPIKAGQRLGSLYFVCLTVFLDCHCAIFMFRLIKSSMSVSTCVRTFYMFSRYCSTLNCIAPWRNWDLTKGDAMGGGASLVTHATM